MTLGLAVQLMEILMGLAITQQSIEHLELKSDYPGLHFLRLLLGVCLLLGPGNPFAPAILFISGIYLLKKYQGPYNGGADRMGLLVLLSLTCLRATNNLQIQEPLLAYVAVQSILSYFLAGLAKARHKMWWNGTALRNLLSQSHYVAKTFVSKSFPAQGLCVLLLVFELGFPFLLLNKYLLFAGLALAFLFHLINARILGLNRFVWVWLSTYPALIWLEARI